MRRASGTPSIGTADGREKPSESDSVRISDAMSRLESERGVPSISNKIQTHRNAAAHINPTLQYRVIGRGPFVSQLRIGEIRRLMTK